MTKLDPYAELKVPLDADEKTIRRAYRKASKAAHPDAGGDPAKWERVSTALAVLTDPDLRRTYDETGEIGEKKPDNTRAAAINVIEAHMAGVMAAYLNQGKKARFDPRKTDIPKRIVDSIKKEIGQARANIEDGKDTMKFLEDVARRFTANNGQSAEENVFARGIAVQIRAAEAALAEVHKAIATHELAIKIVEGYKFDADPPEQMSYDYATTGATTWR